MIDSVLKGNGNSRFLKSAVPAGTSWADALAMLQAGTFPIDFNGINSEGFQQVGTPLNKANLLKDATAAQIGLPPSTTPDGMFQALGNTGELHVWRKTVTTAQDIPAGYTLGEVQNVTKYPITNVRSGGHTIVTKAYSNLSVDDAGNVSVDESSYVNFYNDASAVRGKFIQVYSDGDILFIPNDANISTDYETVGSAVIHNHYTDKYQTVTGYPLIPAGTTTTYPVSTNPNAYQEGDDAKPAGYTLGEVVTSKVKLGYSRLSSGMFYYYADTLSVSEDGKVSISTQNSYQVNRNSNTSDLKTAMAGKFIQLYGSSGSAMELSGPFSTIPGEIVFIPADTSFNTETIRGDDYFTIDRYQPVTGYAAIPAGTTIEYLGKLGDKARMQVVSYVGTGTYGSSNPCSVTFNFPPKVVRLLGEISSGGNFTVCSIYPKNTNYGIHSAILFTKALTTTYKARLGFSENNYTASYCKISQDGKTVTWYNNGDDQINTAGYTYYFLALG